jgi:uncharacterized membrane protein required for colicin V production
MNALFLVVALIFLIFMILGYTRGLFRSVFKLLAGVLAMTLSYLLAPLIGNIIINYTTIDDSISNVIETKIEETVRENVESEIKTQLETATGMASSYIDQATIDSAVNETMQTELTRNQQIELINNISAPEFIKNALIENNQDSIKKSLGAGNFYEYIARYISRMVVNAISFAITGCLTGVILSIISSMLSGAVRIPIINNINRIGGIVFGFVEALVIVWILFAVIGLVMGTTQGAVWYNQITENKLLGIINDKNIINDIIAGIMKISD